MRLKSSKWYLFINPKTLLNAINILLSYMKHAKICSFWQNMPFLNKTFKYMPKMLCFTKTKNISFAIYLFINKQMRHQLNNFLGKK